MTWKPVNTKKLRELAEAATPGDAAFIAAANPQTVLALLDEINDLRAPEVHWECQQKIDILEEQITDAIATRDATRRGLGEALDLFDAVWCPEHGHAPKPKQLARAEELRKLVSP